MSKPEEMTWKPIENGTKVRHRQDGYVGFIDGLTGICKGPNRNPDGRTQYRVRVEGKEIRELATADDLETIKRAPREGERFSVYVVQLKGVPGGTGKDVYVGMTGLTPEERYANHKRGYKAGKKIVMRYGVKLLPELYDYLNPLTREEADRMEKETLPRELTAKGFKVYGGH